MVRIARALFLSMMVLGVCAGCAETVRCPDGQVFDEMGECVPIPDAGADAGALDGG